MDIRMALQVHSCWYLAMLINQIGSSLTTSITYIIRQHYTTMLCWQVTSSGQSILRPTHLEISGAIRLHMFLIRFKSKYPHFIFEDISDPLPSLTQVTKICPLLKEGWRVSQMFQRMTIFGISDRGGDELVVISLLILPKSLLFYSPFFNCQRHIK